MSKLTTQLLTAAALAAVTALPASAASVVNVYVGYFNNINGSAPAADIPTPFDSDATTTLLGLGTTQINNDTGVIRFENTSSVNVTIGPLVVFAGSTFYHPWDSMLATPFVLAPGHNLVLAETVNYDFDTSDLPNGSKPKVFGAINDAAFGFDDVHRVLYGHEEAVDFRETTPYDLIGAVQVPVPVPATVLLLGSALAGFGAVGRRRAA